MKIVATSDLHGFVNPPFAVAGASPTIPECDVLVIGGDILPLGVERDWPAVEWLERTFKPWLESVPAKYIIAIAGNHDFAIQDRYYDIEDLALPWTYLQDSGVTIEGISFWGLPWTPNLMTWAFYGPPERQRAVCELVPETTDVTITHSPPQHHGDGGHPEWASEYVNQMLDRVKPRVHLSGHIHEGYGAYLGYGGHTDIYNVAHCDNLYDPVNQPRVITL